MTHLGSYPCFVEMKLWLRLKSQIKGNVRPLE
jgi:hypothetical protein